MRKKTKAVDAKREALKAQIRKILAACGGGQKIEDLDPAARAEYEMLMQYRNANMRSSETADGERIETACKCQK